MTRVVLFDLDGTLVDSVALIRESHRHATRSVLGVDLPDAILVRNVGRPLAEQMAAFDPGRVDPLLAAYREWNLSHTRELLRPYPGIDAMLRAVRATGARTGVVTSKNAGDTALALEIVPIGHHLDVVVTSSDTATHKPDPGPLLLAMARVGAEPGQCTYVGDAPVDMRSARAAAVASVGVTWGFFAEDVLAAESPGRVVHTPAELEEALGAR